MANRFFWTRCEYINPPAGAGGPLLYLPPMSQAQSQAARAKALTLAREVLQIEAQAVAALGERLDERFLTAVELILHCRGRVVVSGMGKSGHIARKIASTLASTGTPAFFVHPAEASHGDLGMITREDVVIALSNSGESPELLTIVPLIKRTGAKLIAVTGKPQSSLAREADVHLDASVAREACPLGLAPTASTTAALALGDALAVALLDARGFGPEDFARSHPGGALGRRLLVHVADVMRRGEALPPVTDAHATFVFLLDETGKVHPLPHGLYLALVRRVATAPEFSGKIVRIAEWYVRLKGNEPETVVNEHYGYLAFDAEGRLDWERSRPEAREALPTREERALIEAALFAAPAAQPQC